MKSPPYTILWSTQGGRAKACARRTARILRDSTNSSGSATNLPDGYYGSSFDDYGARDFLNLGQGSSDNSNGGTDTNKRLIIMFVSTTGDAEQCDSIRDTWKMLLQKSIPADQLKNITFALFCLGDRAYGPTAFCAAGRKLAARLVQLGAKTFCDIGYGDDGTPNGGVFNDCDAWLENHFLEKLLGSRTKTKKGGVGSFAMVPETPYRVTVTGKKGKYGNGAGAAYDASMKEWQMKQYQPSYSEFFASQCPATAYHYNTDDGVRVLGSEGASISTDQRHGQPLLGCTVSNERITAKDWMQDTRHVRIHVGTTMNSDDLASAGLQSDNGGTGITNENTTTGEEIEDPASTRKPLPYMAGDIATIVASNPKSTVDRFISCLPQSIQEVADVPLDISTNITSSTQYSTSFTPWPKHATLRGILTHCADISNLPEREDLRALSFYCNPSHPVGADQKKKLISLSETSDAALYGDYILREKRNWGDILFDFDSIKFEVDGVVSRNELEDPSPIFVPLTIEHLLMILSPIMPRHFSIASAPSSMSDGDDDGGYSLRNGRFGFDLELCIAVVKGKTRYGRPYQGMCSTYLSYLKPSNRQNVRIWIRPGSFGRLPLELDAHGRFETPVMCVGAGTGVAPLRSLLQEREAIRQSRSSASTVNTGGEEQQRQQPDNVLVFGCRQESMDYYYEKEWNELQNQGRVRVLTAFSQDQKHKLYVQKVVREADNGLLIAKHILEDNGAVYIAGGAKMARAVKDEILECLGKSLPSGEAGAKVLLQKLQRVGKFSVEAWS